LGETELAARFGSPTGHSKHFVFAQGKMIEMGPEFIFRQEPGRSLVISSTENTCRLTIGNRGTGRRIKSGWC
jgi:hypothetical protein